MDCDLCMHKKSKNSICIDCGILLSECDFKNEYTANSNFFVPQSCLKYKLEDKNLIVEKALDKVLLLLNLKSFKKEIKASLLNIRFKDRLKIEDKLLLIIFNLRRSYFLPISSGDILKYTSLKKSRFLRILKDSFDFKILPEAYYKQLYERTLDFLNKTKTLANKEVKSIGTFEDFYKIQAKLVNLEIKMVCLGCLILSNRDWKWICKYDSEYPLERMIYIRKRLLQLKKLEAVSGI